MLQLEDNSRVAPAKIPRDANGFKSWSDFACVEWPPEMTIEAYRAWDDLHHRNDNVRLSRFLQNYEEWLLSPETEKIRRMGSDQSDSPSRKFHLELARLTTPNG